MTTLHPNQTRRLPAHLVSLRGPSPDGHIAFPKKGEPLRLRDISRMTGDPWAQAALRKLAEEKAPQSLSQLVLWHVVDGFEWDTIARFSREWSNPNELALARAFVDRLVESEGRPVEKLGDSVLRYELTSRRDQNDPLLKDLQKVLAETTILGLATRDGIATDPAHPCLACRLRLDDEIVQVQLSVSNDAGTGWDSVGKFSIVLKNEEGVDRSAIEIIDQLSEKILGRVIDPELVVKSVKGKRKYAIKINNASPLVLNSLALSGPSRDRKVPPTFLLGLSVPPHRTLTVPASEDAVERLGLSKGVKPIAAELGDL